MNYYSEGINAPLFSYTHEETYNDHIIYQGVTDFLTFKNGYEAIVIVDCEGNLTYERELVAVYTTKLQDLTEDSIIRTKGDRFEKHSLYGSDEPYIFRYTSRERTDDGIYYYGVTPFVNCIPYSEGNTTIFVDKNTDNYTVYCNQEELTLTGKEIANYCSSIHTHTTLYTINVHNNDKKLPVFGYEHTNSRPTFRDKEMHYINLRLNSREHYDIIYPYGILNKDTGILNLYADDNAQYSNPCLMLNINEIQESDLLYSKVRNTYYIKGTPIFSYSLVDDFWSYNFRYRDVVWYVDGYQEYNGCDVIVEIRTTKFKVHNTYDFHKNRVTIAGDLKALDQCYEIEASPI